MTWCVSEVLLCQCMCVYKREGEGEREYCIAKNIGGNANKKCRQIMIWVMKVDRQILISHLFFHLYSMLSIVLHFTLYMYIHTGSIPESDEGKLYNTCTVFNPSGEMLGKYRKVKRSYFTYSLLLFLIVVLFFYGYRCICLILMYLVESDSRNQKY
jgi:hypothetical protein